MIPTARPSESTTTLTWRIVVAQMAVMASAMAYGPLLDADCALFGDTEMAARAQHIVNCPQHCLRRAFGNSTWSAAGVRAYQPLSDLSLAGDAWRARVGSL